MNDFDTVNNLFQEQLLIKLPGLSNESAPSITDEYGNFIVLDIPSSFSHHSLLVFYRDYFEISVAVSGTRGPAEALLGMDKDLPEAIDDTLDYLQDLVSGKIVIDICRYRFFWFKPNYLAWFRDSSEIPNKRTVRTIMWKTQESIAK